VFGVLILIAVVIIGRYIPDSRFAGWFTFGHKSLTILIAVYGFLASVLPVWLLLSPREYLSSIMKITVIALLAIGLIIVAPEIKMPAFTEYGKGGGPIIPGKLFHIFSSQLLAEPFPDFILL
jgi:carbon starvation protein